MELRRTIYLLKRDREVRERAISFWEGRGFRFAVGTNGIRITGTRGSIWGNISSNDMSRVFSHVAVSFIDERRIDTTLTVTPPFQRFTKWNRAYWRLEMATFESWMLRGDLQEALWADFLKESRTATVWWMVSVGMVDPDVPERFG